MNFLLHRHLAEAHTGSRAAGAGAMLPDLWRMADRRVRPCRPVEMGGLLGGRLAEVLVGIRHHVAVDHWFHGDRVFLEGEKLVAARIREAQLEAKRMGLLAHVTWEMCLDGALLRRAGFEATRAALTEGFLAIEGDFEPAATMHHFGTHERTAEERAAFDARMKRLRAEIERGPWIEGYQYGEGVAIRVSGVRARLGLAPLDAADHARLGQALDGVAHEADAILEEILRAPSPLGDGRVRPSAALALGA
ncbi:hypothetical protein [Polyangium jinanense]|uniref:Uncharacterized protein n=1 Tax=Polyangium jinanense TaxID=2829994 RepID=A0A9X3X106_9BACT|nr:hypothetical protein [Polyangium jinanense]MDC3953922.1 hypothetical protein [Polyangium jinanense]MDC3957865.1 hypothetical protein [Polyangium jinanense]MDC3978951.1 hypothetical protein [Polyangium jinanense]MDC3982122.1 hypothetical protein [Polyangium jinanense]